MPDEPLNPTKKLLWDKLQQALAASSAFRAFILPLDAAGHATLSLPGAFPGQTTAVATFYGVGNGTVAVTTVGYRATPSAPDQLDIQAVSAGMVDDTTVVTPGALVSVIVKV